MMNFASGMALGDASSLWSLIPKTPPPAVALKLESRGGVLGLPASPMTCSIEAEKPPNRTTELQPSVEQPDGNIVWRSNKDIAPFARPLSVSSKSAYPDDNKKVRISFKGLPGSHSEDAALAAYPNCESVPCNEFEDAFKAVELWIADKAVLPIENSSGGSIHRNYDLLLRHRLHIVGEVQITTNLCLLALPGVRAEQLKRVLSHPQALSLSDNALNRLGVVRENVDDTAGAAQYVALNNLRDAGVVAGARAAELYGLNILAEGIQDDLGNVTRYLVLAREPIIPRTDRPYRTSIVFTLDEGPGVLFKVLALFALRDINLTKIESRPQRNCPLRVVDDSNMGSAKYFDYLFYIDFEASMAEPRAQLVLGHLQEHATFLRVLGCYPVDVAR
ncbi:arogenate dehydratase/prephenate dehydratase 1, chloroplastic-like isoform X2 [Cucurbita pepo subsp. pepo]|uniref:arogenate dehydratase/prephenate dehydratase 1, chloroplastic-like isoform X2 n=1 Tax=Cucurbita pepo subsp. pepo TaxID=3664 RepID=UPI000C9D7243|nr:arogenate dehydratase/prephenate dehydratase 1, chloroplastic-like isoform X2 [Cucurbita pepo subsp. pepo]